MTTPISDNQELPMQELNILPEWIKSTPKSYETHSGGGGERSDRERRPQGRRPEGAGRGGKGASRPPSPRGDRSPRRDGPPPRRDGAPPRREQGRPSAPVEISFSPEEKGWASMVETMKHSPRAYALFDVAKLVLNKPERHVVKLSLKPSADGKRMPLFVAMGDESVFQSEQDALRHVLRRQTDKFCRQEKKPCDPPKGSFSCINRCGITGEVFGPPNYHEYQTLLVRHHQRRLRHMSYEEFKSRIQTSKEPEAVKQWLESRSSVAEYHCLLCAEPKAVATREELEKHVTETHLAQLVTSGEEVQILGLSSRQQASEGMAEALRLTWSNERRFPLKTAQTLSDRLRQDGFHFFKHGKGVTYVTHIRLKRFETLDGLSDQVQKIITFLRAHPDSVRRQLVENLQPVEEERLLSDLHWLIQEGNVVEFADGRLWALENRQTKPVETEPTAVAEAVVEPSTVVSPPSESPVIPTATDAPDSTQSPVA